MKNYTSLAVTIVLCSGVLSSAYGQISQYVLEVTAPPAVEHTPISLSAELAQNVQTQRVVLRYRQFGESEYKELEMLLAGRSAVITLPAKIISPPYIEYFIELTLVDGKKVTFPDENAEVNPQKLTVRGVDPKDTEVRFLSPEEGETLAAEDLAVAISLMFTSDNVDKSRTKIYLDGADVTSEALLTDDVVLYNPKNFNRALNLGTHAIRVELRDTLGKVYYSKQAAFNLSTASAIEEVKSSLQYAGNAQAEFRNEKVSDVNTTYTRGDVRLNGAYKFLGFGLDMHVTNEDQPDRQPQNRFLATITADEYAKVQVGDAYPTFPSLFISGKRVRGVTGSINTGYFNLDVSYGQTDRKIEGVVLHDTTYADSSGVSSRPTASTPLGGLSYRLYNPGTYARNFIAVRPSFGSGENFQWGMTYIKAKDDVSSIQYGNYPAENLVAGTDLMLAFDNQKIKWTTQVAFSLENTDISKGDLTDAGIDSVKGVYDTTKSAAAHQQAINDATDLKNLAKLGRNFITVNENLTPLDPVSGLPSLAVESELSMNYFNNFIRVLAFRRGKNYKSYGNEFIQTDIEGYNLSDRIRFFDNRVLTSVSYESKWNNVQNDNSKPVTTFNTFNGSLTLYPGVKLPTITLGYGFNTRKNPIDLSAAYATGKPVIMDKDTLNNAGFRLDTTRTVIVNSSDAQSTADEITNRIFFNTNYDFHAWLRQSASATVSISNKTDNTFYKRNQDNVSVSAALTTFYKIPLQTTFAIIVSHNASYFAVQDTSLASSTHSAYLNQTNSTTFNYQTISFNARYRMLNDRLNLIGTVAPSFGDFQRFLIQAGADYQVMENHYVVGQLDFVQNPGRSSDVIFSVVYRLTF